MRWISVIGASVVVVALLTTAGVIFYRPRIERDLVQRTSEALKKRDMPFEQVRFTGRDGILVIEKSDRFDAVDVRKAALAVYGVRIAKVEEVVKSEPTFVAERIGTYLRLGGRISQKDVIASLAESAGRLFGSPNVQNRIEETHLVRNADYLEPLAGMFPIVERVGPEAKLQVEDRVLVVSGLVPDEDIKNSLERAVAERLPAGLRFESRLVVPERKTTAFRAPDLAELFDAIRLHFEFDSTKLTSETSGNIELLKQTLGEYKVERVRISGHADSIGEEAYNVALSRRRARSIQKKLISSGIADRFELEAKGESDPVADNATAEGRQLNRRVAFGIAEGQ